MVKHQFVVEVVITRGDEHRHAISRGRDGYAVTASLASEAVERLLKGKFRSAGAHAPGEIFDAIDLLAAIAPDHSTFEVIAGRSLAAAPEEESDIKPEKRCISLGSTSKRSST